MGIVTDRALEIVKNMLLDEKIRNNADGWIRANEPDLLAWAKVRANEQVDKIFEGSGGASKEDPIVKKILMYLTSNIVVGHIITSVASNDKMGEEYNIDIIGESYNSNKNTLHDMWMKGLLESKFYDPTNEDIDVDALGDDWTTAVGNFNKILSKNKKGSAKVRLNALIAKDTTSMETIEKEETEASDDLEI